jgi:hypothetical protein
MLASAYHTCLEVSPYIVNGLFSEREALIQLNKFWSFLTQIMYFGLRIAGPSSLVRSFDGHGSIPSIMSTISLLRRIGMKMDNHWR